MTQQNNVENNTPPVPPRAAIVFTPLPGQPLNLQQGNREDRTDYHLKLFEHVILERTGRVKLIYDHN